MRKVTRKVTNKNGDSFRQQKELRYLLNYGIADLLNKAILNKYHLPVHHCNPSIYPDFIALNTEPSKFHHTSRTALGFYSYDRSFDKIDGLYNAIYYRDKELLRSFREQYKDIKFVIGPDYSIFDNVWNYENKSRLFKIRIAMLWFVLETGAVVIPNAIYASLDRLPEYLSGFENCTVMCFSTKGHVRNSKDRRRVKETVKYVVDNFPLKVLLVYSVCGNDATSLKLFNYAASNGVEVRIVNNTMRERNQFL